MTEDVMVESWMLYYGVWFNEPYRIWHSPISYDYCLWWWRNKTSRCVQRGFATAEEAKRASERHREKQRIKDLII